MHIIIGVLTAIAGLVWALHSLHNSGVDINSFNPFTWARRRRWEKLYGAKPLFNLEKPMEAAAVLIVGTLTQEGVITSDQKAQVVDMFVRHFHLSNENAASLFASSAHMVKNEINLHESVKSILAPCLDSLTPDMKDTLVDMLNDVARLDGMEYERFNSHDNRSCNRCSKKYSG